MEAKPNRKLLQTQLQDAEYQRRDLIARPEPGTALDEMLVPAYWANCAKTLKPWDRIEVRPPDGAWWAELLVRVVEPFSASVHVLRVERFKAKSGEALADIVAPDGYQFVHRGAKGWSVMRVDDKVDLRAGEASKEAAAAWLAGHLRKLAA